MNWRKLITLIISVDEGRSFYWSLPCWRLLLWASMGAFCLGLLLFVSIDYLFAHGRLNNLQAQLADITKQAQAFEKRLFFADKRNFESSYSPPAVEGDEDYQLPLSLKSARAWVGSNTVELDFVLQLRSTGSSYGGDSLSNVPSPLSGTMVAVLANEDETPVQYLSIPRMNVTERGFPSNRFAGIHFYQVRRKLHFRRRVSLSVNRDYFTHVLLYVFSSRGGIIWHQRFKMEREWFARPIEHEPHPLVSTF